MSAGAGPHVPRIAGTVAPGFERVRRAFAENFAQRGEVGAGFCAYVDGVEVVDVWAGWARSESPWTRDTVACVYSATKGIAALVLHVLADRGVLSVDRPVADYWPAFAAAGKRDVTVRMVLTHTAGVPWFPRFWELVSFDDPRGWGDLAEIADRLAGADPLWAPGSRLRYHSVTYGWLIGELVRRTTGMTLGRFLRDEIAGPLGVDVQVGLPAHDHHRVAELAFNEALSPLHLRPPPDHGTWQGNSLFIGPQRGGLVALGNQPEFWAAEAPAINGVAGARGLARIYALLARGGELEGTRLVSRGSVQAHTAEQVRAHDANRGVEIRSALGYARPSPDFQRFGPREEAFGCRGYGGSIGFADPVARIGVGYVTNGIAAAGGVADPRVEALVDALYRSIEGPTSGR